MAYVSNPWRDAMSPAYFRNENMGGREARFHVESGSKESGRRIVVHEFPKKDLPYSEDMGRRPMEFSVRGYAIQYPRDIEGSRLYQRDYRLARDDLMAHLDAEGPGILQLPHLPPMRVVCQRYRMQEEERVGGYCTFDMSFVELGAPPFQEVTAARDNMIAMSVALMQVVQENLQRGRTTEAIQPLSLLQPTEQAEGESVPT
jgi:prophage DNA circulation protein